MLLLIRAQLTRLIDLYLDKRNKPTDSLFSCFVSHCREETAELCLRVHYEVAQSTYLASSSPMFSSSPMACSLLSVGYREYTDSRPPLHSSSTSFTLEAENTRGLQEDRSSDLLVKSCSHWLCW